MTWASCFKSMQRTLPMVVQTVMTQMIVLRQKSIIALLCKKFLCKKFTETTAKYFSYTFCLLALFALTVPTAIAQTSTAKPAAKAKTQTAQSATSKKTAAKAPAKTKTSVKAPVKKVAAAPLKKKATTTTIKKASKNRQVTNATLGIKAGTPVKKPQPVPAAVMQALTPRYEAKPPVYIPPQPGKYSNDFVSNFESYVESKIVPKVPGVALAVIANGRVKVLQAYGVKRVNGSDPINVNTAFRLASVSKTIGATAGALLVRDGLANWDTSVTSVLPDVVFKDPRYGDQLTIRNILSQATGLPTHTNDNFIEEGLPFDEVVRRLRYVNFVCPPGKCYSYQNVTYSLISNIIQKKTGKTYEQYVQEKVFDPLGMRTASFGMLGLKGNNNYALPHVMTRSGWYTETITENYYRINPAAGANASITDMSQWLLAQMGHNPEVLSPATLNTLHDKVTRNTATQSHYGTREGVTDTHYGLGWRVFDYRGDKNFIHHGGYVLGFRSEMVFNAELQIGMVILSNSNKLGGDVIFKFLDAYEDDKRGTKLVSTNK